MQSERALTTSIIEVLNYSGKYFCWRINSGAMPYTYKGRTGIVRMAAAGTSDIGGIVKRSGQYICLEVKLPKTIKSLTQLQQDYLDKMARFGAITGVVTSPEDALKILNDYS